VLINRKLVSIARKAHADQHDAAYEARAVRAFMTRDEDGQYYFDYVSWRSVVETAGMDDDNYPLYLRDLASILKRGLSSTEPNVLSKYLWLHRQYVAGIEQFEKLGTNHPYRINNPENCDAIEQLPKLNEEAKKAARIMKTSNRKSSN
jgi:hypothetical protein